MIRPKFLKRPTRLIPLLSVLILAAIVYAIGDHPRTTGPVEGTHLDGRPATQQAGSRYLLVATFNIDSGQGTDGQVDLARTAKCLQKIDFIGMNEVHGFLWGEPKNQAESLSDILHLPYLYVPVEKRWGEETFGNAVFSDLPITHWQRIVLPSERLKSKRNYLLTDATWHGKTIHFLTTHTDWKSGGEAQFKIVRDVFLSLPTPAILMGDLNTPASSPLIEDLKKTPGVQEAIDTQLDKIGGRVDWIFLRGLETHNAGKVDIGASDHPAYWASVELK
jgi:endonuclease/exonuclease/phosphatase family metal-dependent hydrolase